MGGVLVVTAHPDDEALIAGGLLAACARAGVPTGVACLTRGELGEVADPAALGSRPLAEVRVQELRAACATLGVSWVRCFRRGDGVLRWAPRRELIGQLSRLIGRLRPAAVVTFGDDGLYYHPDHLAVAELSRAAVAAFGRGAGRPALYRAVWPAAVSVELVGELERRGLPSGLWGLAPEDFGIDEEVEAVELDLRDFAATKLAALRCHRSQIGPEHAFAAVPEDVFAEHLGCERFAAVEASAGWLETALAMAHA